MATTDACGAITMCGCASFVMRRAARAVGWPRRGDVASCREMTCGWMEGPMPIRVLYLYRSACKPASDDRSGIVQLKVPLARSFLKAIQCSRKKNDHLHKLWCFTNHNIFALFR